MPHLSDHRQNNFNILRLVAASAVIFSHAYEITGQEHDVFKTWIGYSGGWIAVSAFFSISGMLIYKSIVRSGSVRDYMIARCLRIFPGLWAMLFLSVMFLGIFFSSLPPTIFFSDLQVSEYFLGNSVLYLPRYFLPGVFEMNNIEAVNGSLWTLRFEFTCYLITLLLFLIGAYRNERTFLTFAAIYLLVYFGYVGYSVWQGNLQSLLYDGSDIDKLHRLFFAFFVGILMGRYVEHFRPGLWLVLLSLALCYLTFETALFLSSLMLFIGTTLFWLAFIQGSWLEPFRTMPDYSYGIYIYAFPIQQIVAQVAPHASPMANSVISLALTLPFAAASWHLIEKPALGLKARLSTKKAPG